MSSCSFPLELRPLTLSEDMVIRFLYCGEFCKGGGEVELEGRDRDVEWDD